MLACASSVAVCPSGTAAEITAPIDAPPPGPQSDSLAGPAQADDDSTTLPGAASPTATPERYQLGEIAVGRKRKAPPSTVQRVAPKAVALQSARTANDLMRLVPGAHVPMNSRGEQFVFLRDAGERQVAVFLDGAQLTIPWDYAIDLGMVPAGLIGGMTVVKGASSVLWGANVIGGAVNLLTREQQGDGLSTEVTLSGGAPSRWAAQLSHLGRRGPWSWSAGAQLSTQDDLPLAAGALDTPRSAPFGNAGLDDRRNNTAAQQLAGMVRGVYEGDGGGRLAVTLLHLGALKNIPPQGNLDPAKDKVRFWRYPLWQNSMAIVAGELPWGEGGRPGSLKGSVWLQRFAQTIDAYKDEFFADGGRAAHQEDLDLTVGARLALEQAAGPGSFRLVVNELYSDHGQTDYACQGLQCAASLPTGVTTADTAGAQQHYSQNILSTGAEYEARLLGQRLVLQVGGGYDVVAMQEIGAFAQKGAAPTYSDWSGLLAARYALPRGLYVRSAVGRKTRFPTQRELYGVALGKFLPNPDLKPEAALLSEVGLGLDIVGKSRAGQSRTGEDRTGEDRAGEDRAGEVRTGLHAEVTVFYSDSQDTLDKHTVSVQEDGKSVKKEQRYNLKGAHILGVEAAFALRPWRYLSVDGHLTLVDARAWDPATGDYTGHLQRRPVATGLAALGWAPDEGPQLQVQTVISGGSYSVDAAGQLARLDGAVLLGARVGWKARWLAQEGEVFARVDNALDALYLPTDGFPEPGRSVVAGVRAQF